MLKYLKFPVLALAVSLLGTASFAPNWGIRFDQMPVGTSYETKKQNGDRIVSKFVGKQGKYYIVEDTLLKTGRKFRVKYNAAGHFVSVTNVSGGSSYRVKQTPHSCYMVVGDCMQFASGSTRNTGRYLYSIKQVSATKRVGTWRRVTTEETQDFKYTIGKYNLVIDSEHKNGSRTFTNKITRITEPNG